MTVEHGGQWMIRRPTAQELIDRKILTPRRLAQCPRIQVYDYEAEFVSRLQAKLQIRTILRKEELSPAANPYISSVYLAARFLQNPELVKGKRVLDMGAGTGVVAIAARMAGARSVMAVDIEVAQTDLIARNAALNRVEVKVKQGSMFSTDLYRDHDVIVLSAVMHFAMKQKNYFQYGRFLRDLALQGKTIIFSTFDALPPFHLSQLDVLCDGARDARNRVNGLEMSVASWKSLTRRSRRSSARPWGLYRQRLELRRQGIRYP